MEMSSQLQVEVLAEGSVQDYRPALMGAAMASLLGVDADDVTVTVTASSVLIRYTIRVENPVLAATFAVALQSQLASAASTTRLLGLPAARAPSVVHLLRPRVMLPSPAAPALLLKTQGVNVNESPAAQSMTAQIGTVIGSVVGSILAISAIPACVLVAWLRRRNKLPTHRQELASRSAEGGWMDLTHALTAPSMPFIAGRPPSTANAAVNLKRAREATNLLSTDRSQQGSSQQGSQQDSQQGSQQDSQPDEPMARHNPHHLRAIGIYDPETTRIAGTPPPQLHSSAGLHSSGLHSSAGTPPGICIAGTPQGKSAAPPRPQLGQVSAEMVDDVGAGVMAHHVEQSPYREARRGLHSSAAAPGVHASQPVLASIHPYTPYSSAPCIGFSALAPSPSLERMRQTRRGRGQAMLGDSMRPPSLLRSKADSNQPARRVEQINVTHAEPTNLMSAFDEINVTHAEPTNLMSAFDAVNWNGVRMAQGTDRSALSMADAMQDGHVQTSPRAPHSRRHSKS